MFITKIIIALLIVIIILYSCHNSFKQIIFSNKLLNIENFKNLDTNKEQKPISDAERSIILLEIINAVQKHETVLNVVNPDYEKQNINVDRNTSRINNISKLLNIMYLQDEEIYKLLPTYVPSNDLQGLLNGTTLQSLNTQLDIAKITPIKPQIEVDPNAMNELAQNFYDTANHYENDSITAMTFSTQGNMYQTNAIKASYSNSLVNDQIYNPKQLNDDKAQSILESNIFSIMISIINYQELAISTILNNLSIDILGVYKKKK